MRKFLVSAFASLTSVGLALAQTTGTTTGPNFSNIQPDLSAVWGLAGSIIGALVTMIVVRKGIKLANRS